MVGKLPGGVTDIESLLTGCGGGSIVTRVSACYLQALSLRRSIILLLGLVVYAYYCLSGRQRILLKMSICRKIHVYFCIFLNILFNYIVLG